MTRIRTFFRSSFGSALLGGIVAVALGVVAITSGIVSVDNSSGSTAASSPPITPATEPASGAGRTVGQVYQDDAQGVAFISAEEKPTDLGVAVRRPVRRRAPRPARASSSTPTATSSRTLTSSTARAR